MANTRGSIVMNDFYIKIKDQTHCEKVQKQLFAQGYSWPTVLRSCIHTNILYIHAWPISKSLSFASWISSEYKDVPIYDEIPLPEEDPIS